MAEPNDAPGVLAHPPLIYLGFLVVALAIDWIWPAPVLPQSSQYWVAAALFALGLGAAVPAFLRFVRAGTNVPTNRPATALVTHGPYRFSRNPIYVGLTLAYLAIAVAIDSLWAIFMLAAVLPVMHYGVVLREERYLERKFGEDYRRYRAAVRRWL